MRISEDIRRATVFLGWQGEGPEDEAPIDPRGVGFLIAGEAAKGAGTYLVTAKHVAETLTPPFVIRFNRTGGGSGLQHIDSPNHIRWYTHPDKTVDLAVAPIEKPSWSDNLRYGLDDVIQAEGSFRDAVGAGDGAYVVGMFHRVHGTKRNLPVVYPGHVVLLPGDERIPVNDSDVEGYLVQANPISGCSGAPVWAANLVMVQPPQQEQNSRFTFYAEGNLFLLGVWQSSWKVRGSEIVSLPADDLDEDDRKGALAPLGMGVVIPTEKLIEIFRETDVAKERTELYKRERLENSATPDFLSGKPSVSAKTASLPASDENPTHRERFDRLMRKAAKAQPDKG